MIKFQLGPENLNIDFKFELIRTVGKLRLVGEQLGSFDRVGLCFSGGLDSTALLCLLLTEMRDTDLLEKMPPITCFTYLKNDGCTYYAHRLVDRIKKLFNCEINHVTNLENPYMNVMPSFFTENEILPIREKYPNTVLFSGINRPSHELANFKNKGTSATPDRSEQILGITVPFLNMHKPQILDLYYKLNIEELIPYTHSCMFEPINTCNDCYSCEERAWGFRELGKIDPGTVPPDVSDITFNGTWAVS
jgi:hypothetical protein